MTPPYCPRRVEQADEATHIDLMGGGKLAVGPLHGCHRGQMEAAVHTVHRFAEQLRVGDAATRKVGGRVASGEPAGDHVIEHAHAVAAADKRVHKIRADEPAASRD